MRLISSRLFAAGSSIAAALFSAWSAGAATRPRYGGVLRVEIREPLPAADTPEARRRMGPLGPAFKLDRWEPGRGAYYTADENSAGGRPFLDGVEIQMGKPLRQQSIDLGLGKADIVEMGPEDVRRPAAGRGVWSSAPVRVLALVFHPRIEDARLRESLALAVDRAAIHNVLLQRLGESAGALLPQWLSGYAFLFSTAADLPKARALAASLPPAGRRISLAAGEPSLQPIAERIALNARDAGLAVALAPASATADVRLVEARIVSSDAPRALAALAGALGLPQPPGGDSPEALYAAERALLEGFRAIPLFHLPDVYGAGPHVKGGPGITGLGEWRFENLWLEGPRP
jgi:peptide/nickel transport system substrate-binding protein